MSRRKLGSRGRADSMFRAAGWHARHSTVSGSVPDNRVAGL
jgi:hypothetical protein